VLGFRVRVSMVKVSRLRVSRVMVSLRIRIRDGVNVVTRKSRVAPHIVAMYCIGLFRLHNAMKRMRRKNVRSHWIGRVSYIRIDLCYFCFR